MNTTIDKSLDYSEISENLSRSLAYADNQDVDYFLIQDEDGNIRAFVDSEEDNRARWNEFGTDEFPTFLDFLMSETTEIEEQDSDYEYDDRYRVLTDEEADELAKEYILESVWAFNPSFLSGETGIDEEVFKAIQENGKCESNNDAILSCIDDEDSFVDAAIRADGRGHFISMYDGNEDEQHTDFGTFYIYRVN